MKGIRVESIMSDNQVRKLWGRKFDVVGERLAESQVADFVGELIRQRDALLEEKQSLLSCIRLIKGVIRQSEKLTGSGRQQAKNRTAKAVTEVKPGTQSEARAIELEQVAPPVPSETTRADETIGEEELTLYQGELELAILPPVNAAELLQFERKLRNSFPLRILGTNGSPSKGSLIIVLLGEPQPLIHSLKQIPEVKDVAEELDISSEVKGGLIPHFKNGHRKRLWLTIGKKE